MMVDCVISSHNLSSYFMIYDIDCLLSTNISSTFHLPTDLKIKRDFSYQTRKTNTRLTNYRLENDFWSYFLSSDLISWFLFLSSQSQSLISFLGALQKLCNHPILLKKSDNDQEKERKLNLDIGIFLILFIGWWLVDIGIFNSIGWLIEIDGMKYEIIS